MGELLAVSLAGMVVYLDTTAVAQFMICQPLIACPLGGILAGRPEIGLFFGVTFQFIWLGSLPVGAARFPEGNLGALVATALAARMAPAAGVDPGWSALALAALIGILVAHLGSEVTPLVRRLLGPYCERVVAAAAAGQSARFSRLFAGAVGFHALAGLLLTAVAYLIGKGVLEVVGRGLALTPAVMEQTERLASGIWPALLGAGMAVIVGRFVRRSTLVWTAAAFGLALGVGWLWL
jgi:mannose/fructose/N-acetylgalactosamine-specific phosphotransferase system component IIC